ncbi:MAG: recombinase family protein [Pseudomonadota bacterium]|nr:recombinase family protein [Pseudomonadota bacterium]
MRRSSRPSGSAKLIRQVRCAIYTRKSTEEGLDQEFNSLDAQYEACAAYIQSQRQEGWTLLAGRYDDGAYSGGNMERPGLQRLLADVRAGKVDVIVVYKVDRLTRSLTDFAKIVEALDGAGASFVSITQSFNTTTSMGRLTLNVLLSFAQFEREVISERVRDKVAASKAKGIWMGGTVPLGYDARDRKLIVNWAEAQTVRLIMRRYLELGSVRELIKDLERRGIRTKVQQMRDGSTRGGGSFAKGPLYHLLKNRVYLGEIVHHEKSYPGEHQPLVDPILFKEVQALLAQNAAQRSSGGGYRHVSLLAGMIRDAQDRPMTPSHANKAGRRYRYYVSNIAVPGDGTPAGRVLRVPAAGLEQTVRTAVADVLQGAESLRSHSEQLQGSELKHAMVSLRKLAERVRDEQVGCCREILHKLDLQITVEAQRITASCSADRLMRQIGAPIDCADERLPVAMVMRVISRGSELRLIFVPPGGRRPRLDRRLIEFLARAHEARDELMKIGDIAAGRRRELTRFAKFSYLAPDITSAILEGQHPDELGVRKLKRIQELPLCWDQQRQLLGFG